jgi:nicotinate-nucleotide adenylyltransferase
VSQAEGAPARVAVFGGSFNPPHVVHVMAALWVLETQPVDALWVVPTYRHVFEKQLAAFEDRVEMLRLALAPLGPRVTVSTLERDLAGADGAPSRTLDTIEALIARHPDTAFRLVVGTDIWADRPRWHRWDTLAALAPPIWLGRQGVATPPELGRLVELPGFSSTEVRQRLARGEEVAALVPGRVLEYLSRRGLYRNP